ncbi:MAG: asparagine synthase (glutamine-hydrolyzing) [Deltaproteobacteria bacterium]|nr:asparagine synthase (glutamine-hydrolyzing) [Deltaproteobacteria bacterium]
MCGIAGAVGLIDDDVVGAVRSMSRAQAHRGPDGEGFFQSATGDFEVALAHRRLAIIDLSTNANQPMVEPASGCVVVFNGEIYNFAELRAELAAKGAVFRTKSDTEVILHAWLAWGPDAVKRFRGIFAFALWDPRARTLSLVRDPLGVKPLYVAQRGATLYFASEVRALLDGGQPRRLDPTGLAGFAWQGFVRGPGTVVEGVQLLPAASTLTLTAASPRQAPTSWWSLPKARPGTTSRERLAEVLREAVRLQLVADVPLAVFLSGGVDSSAVAALAVEAGQGRVRTVNIGFDEAALDESRYAAAVARALGTEHQSLTITGADFERQLPDALASLDQPTFDGINTYLVSRAVRAAGMTVALAGTGGDELFGGYRSFVDLPRALRVPRGGALGGAAHLLARGLTRAALTLGQVPPQTRFGKLADVLGAEDLVALYQASYALFSRELYAELTAPLAARLAAHLTDGLTAEQRRALGAVSGAPALHAVGNLELASFIGERLLRDTDAASMAASLEARVPLLDHVLIETVAGMDEDARFRPLGKKQALRDAALGRLDPKLFDRPKQGFVLPIEAWAKKTLKPAMDEVYGDARALASVGLDARAAAALWRSFSAGRPGIYWSRVWAPFVLVDWARRHRLTL